MAVCINFLIPRQTLFQKIRNIDDNILSESECNFILCSNENILNVSNKK